MRKRFFLFDDNRLFHLICMFLLLVVALLCLIPFLLLFMASVTDEIELVAQGYTLFPKKISFDAYAYLLKQINKIGHAYGITIFVTVVGTGISFILTTLMAYPLSRKNLPFGGAMNFIVIFTMLFNGGMVPTYLVYTQQLGLKNTIWALIIPKLLLSAFHVILVKNYFANSIPDSLIECAYLDGASELKIYMKIMLPLSVPILATVTLMTALNYWNDWYNGLLYITDQNLKSLQVFLNDIMTNIQALAAKATENVGMDRFIEMPSTSIRMAIACIGVLPMLIIYPFFQKYFVKGITLGAVKG